MLVEEVEVGSFQINNGQRYDVLPCQRPADRQLVSSAPVFIRATMMDEYLPSPRYEAQHACAHVDGSFQHLHVTPDCRPPELTGTIQQRPYVLQVTLCLGLCYSDNTGLT